MNLEGGAHLANNRTHQSWVFTGSSLLSSLTSGARDSARLRRVRRTLLPSVELELWKFSGQAETWNLLAFHTDISFQQDLVACVRERVRPEDYIVAALLCCAIREHRMALLLKGRKGESCEGDEALSSSEEELLDKWISKISIAVNNQKCLTLD